MQGVEIPFLYEKKAFLYEKKIQSIEWKCTVIQDFTSRVQEKTEDKSKLALNLTKFQIQ